MSDNFSFSELDNLLFNDQKTYLSSKLIQLSSGDHAIKVNGEWKIENNQVINTVYLNRFDEKLRKWYVKENKDIKHIVCELNKPQFYENKINMCPTIQAKYTPYKDIKQETKDNMQVFLKYIWEVLASESKENYEFILKWISNALKGNKNASCIYLKGPQGIGKSTISDFLKEWVVGDGLFLETGSNPFKSSFNMITCSRLFIQLSELENCSTNEWSALSSTIKRLITSPTTCYEEKNQKRLQAKNISNYIIDSNNDSIKDDEGRRFYIADLSLKYRENHQYFGNLRNKCFNQEVANAFYSYMLEYDTTGFNAQDYPITKSKLDSFQKRIEPIYEFIKDKYILQDNQFNILATDLFNDFWYKVADTQKKKYPRAKLREILEIVGIVYKKQKNGNFYYNYTKDELITIANKYHWLDDIDVAEIENTNFSEDVNYEEEVFNLNSQLNQEKQRNETLRLETEDWKRKYEELLQTKKDVENPVKVEPTLKVQPIKVKKIIKRKQTPPPIQVNNVDVEFHKIYKQNEITDETLMDLF
jgi:hypothetical protein